MYCCRPWWWPGKFWSLYCSTFYTNALGNWYNCTLITHYLIDWGAVWSSAVIRLTVPNRECPVEWDESWDSTTTLCQLIGCIMSSLVDAHPCYHIRLCLNVSWRNRNELECKSKKGFESDKNSFSQFTTIWNVLSNLIARNRLLADFHIDNCGLWNALLCPHAFGCVLFI